MLRRLGMVLGLTAAIAGAPGAEGASPFDGQYPGELTLTRLIEGDCTTPPQGALYPLRVSDGQVRFAYVPRFATTLTGTVAADGSFTATASARRGVVQMSGRIRGSNVTAEIVSPSCRYTFQTRN